MAQAIGFPKCFCGQGVLGGRAASPTSLAAKANIQRSPDAGGTCDDPAPDVAQATQDTSEDIHEDKRKAYGAGDDEPQGAELHNPQPAAEAYMRAWRSRDGEQQKTKPE